jgi:hypothetical protein
MFKLILPAALLLVSSTAFAQAQPDVQEQKPQNASQSKAKTRVICRDEGEIGSRLASHRICLTDDQWRLRQQEDRDNIAERQRRTPN